MVEISTIDGRCVITMNGDIAADASPEAHTFQGYYEDILTVNLTQIVLLTILLAFILHHLGVLGLSLSTIKVANVERVENLFLHVESHVSILHGLQSLIDESQQESHDDYEYRAIYNNVRVRICIQFHLVPPLFKRFEILRSTMKWSIVGANILPKKMASIIPSG